MIVVLADTSPLNYLVLIRCQDLLPALYKRVLIPNAVVEELDHGRSPAIVRALAKPSSRMDHRSPSGTASTTLEGLDPEAIQLANEEHLDLLLMDDRIDVNYARRQGLEVTGTLGILIQARYGLVDIDVALANLQATDFRCRAQLFQRARDQARIKL
jgi:predicted nucleic acid-binding protein